MTLIKLHALLQGYGFDLLLATWLTVRLAICSLLFGLLFGALSAWAKLSQKVFLVGIINFLTGIIRGVPELLIIFLVYFGSGALLSFLFHENIQVSSFVSGMLALGLIFGAYAAETIRGAFLTLDKGQLQAAQAFGFSFTQRFIYFIFPPLWRFALPGLGNLWLVLVKDTSLISLLGLIDLMGQANLAAMATRQPFNFYFIAALIYLILTSVSLLGIHSLERSTRRGTK